MQLYEPISEDSLFDEITRICGATSAVYTNKQRVARLNSALDRYWKLASDAAPRGTFDDVNNTSLPVETQNLASGTNAYKMSSFTNEVLQILKLTVLADNTDERELIREEFEDLEWFTKYYSTASADQGEPVYWTKMGDYLYLRPCPNYNETNGLRAYVNRELSKFSWVTFTVTIAAPGVVTKTSHGLVNGDAVILETDGALPTGLTADTTIYYVTKVDADTFKLSTTPSSVGSTYITTSGSQSGTHKYTRVNKEPGIPVIHHPYLAKHASVPFLSEKKLANLGFTVQDVAREEQSILEYWQDMDKTIKTIITPRRRPSR